MFFVFCLSLHVLERTCWLLIHGKAIERKIPCSEPGEQVLGRGAPLKTGEPKTRLRKRAKTEETGCGEGHPSLPACEPRQQGKMADFQTPIDSLPSQLHFPSPRANQLLITAARGEHQRDLIMVGKCQITLNLNQIPDI